MVLDHIFTLFQFEETKVLSIQSFHMKIELDVSIIYGTLFGRIIFICINHFRTELL